MSCLKVLFFLLFLTAMFLSDRGVAYAQSTNSKLAIKTSSEARSSQNSDTTPIGMVAFFSPTTTGCPAGWVTPDTLRGRLIVGVTDGNRVGGITRGAMGDRVLPTHFHTYSAKIKLNSKSLQAGSGNNKAGAKAKTYTINAQTDLATPDLPFYQLVICQKQ
jgi:hypothetical protein